MKVFHANSIPLSANPKVGKGSTDCQQKRPNRNGWVFLSRSFTILIWVTDNLAIFPGSMQSLHPDTRNRAIVRSGICRNQPSPLSHGH